jgi:hypothetical protein
MKNKFKLPLAMRLEIRKRMRDWRARNPEKDREIKRRYYRNKKQRLFAEERKQREQKPRLVIKKMFRRER